MNQVYIFNNTINNNIIHSTENDNNIIIKNSQFYQNSVFQSEIYLNLKTIVFIESSIFDGFEYNNLNSMSLMSLLDCCILGYFQLDENQTKILQTPQTKPHE